MDKKRTISGTMVAQAVEQGVQTALEALGLKTGTDRRPHPPGRGPQRPTSDGPSPLRDSDISIGLLVDVVIGPKKYAPGEVTDIWRSTQGGITYQVTRTDGGSSLTPKESTELFPHGSQAMNYAKKSAPAPQSGRRRQ